MAEQSLLEIYLGDHFAGSTAGLNLAQRIAAETGDPRLGRIAGEIDADREVLREVMTATGTETPLLKSAAAWVGERAGRLKLNDRIFGRSPLSTVLELEGLIAGVSGKLQLWRALSEVAGRDPRLASFDFETLATRAEDQRGRLEGLHKEAVAAALDG